MQSRLIGTRSLNRQQQIQKHHGPISDLKICKGHFSEANEMLNDMDTLQDYGIEGAPESEPETVPHYLRSYHSHTG